MARGAPIAELAVAEPAEVGKLLTFPITAYVFHRTEFRGVGEQPLDREPVLPAWIDSVTGLRPVRR